MSTYSLLLWIVLLHEDSGAVYTEFMGIVLNVINYNSAYLDSDVICSLVSFISHICVITNFPANVALCLQCLDAIICYSYIPKGMQPLFDPGGCSSKTQYHNKGRDGVTLLHKA